MAWFILIAEGGGWPTHAIGPFDDQPAAEEHLEADKWLASWGSVSEEPRNLPVYSPKVSQ
jgi:hypothetical protein